MSHFADRYGPADLGREGIRDFFSNHRCNRFCKSHWTKPKVTGKTRYGRILGTTMTPLPTRADRRHYDVSDDDLWPDYVSDYAEYDDEWVSIKASGECEMFSANTARTHNTRCRVYIAEK